MGEAERLLPKRVSGRRRRRSLIEREAEKRRQSCTAEGCRGGRQGEAEAEERRNSGLSDTHCRSPRASNPGTCKTGPWLQLERSNGLSRGGRALAYEHMSALRMHVD